VRLALYGGTFDPIHLGHLILAEYVRTELALAKVLFIPAPQPPHKAVANLTPVEHRLRMVELALEGNPHFEISTVELDRGGPAFTVDTVRHFRMLEGLRRDELFLLIGADSLIDLPQWRQPEEILQLATVVVFPRPECHLDEAEPRFREQCLLVNTPLIGISSTEIRNRVRWGLSIRYLVPRQVEKYIQGHGLYR